MAGNGPSIRQLLCLPGPKKTEQKSGLTVNNFLNCDSTPRWLTVS